MCGREGAGVASARAPRAPCHCLGPCRLSSARLASALWLPQFALSPASRLPTLARSLSPSLPPSLAHKQDGGCCFFPLPNPPYRLAVAAAAGNEPRGGEKKGRGWASGGRWRGGGAWARAAHTMGEEDPGAGPVPITGSAQGPNTVGASANSPGVTRWLPLKGRTWRQGGGAQGPTRDLFSVGGHLRGKVPGLGLCVGDRWERGVTEPGSCTGEGARSRRRWPNRSAVGMALRPGSLGGQSSEPQWIQPGRGYPVVGQCFW